MCLQWSWLKFTEDNVYSIKLQAIWEQSMWRCDKQLYYWMWDSACAYLYQPPPVVTGASSLLKSRAKIQDRAQDIGPFKCSKFVYSPMFDFKLLFHILGRICFCVRPQNFSNSTSLNGSIIIFFVNIYYVSANTLADSTRSWFRGGLDWFIKICFVMKIYENETKQS